MDEKTKSKVLEIIRNAINEIVYDEVKRMPETIQKKQTELKKTKSQKEQDVHDALFGSKDVEYTRRIRLRENSERPSITTMELDNFEKELVSRMPNVVLHKQVGQGQNGQIVNFPIKKGQKDAVCIGTLKFEQNSFDFLMSLTDGLTIKTPIHKGVQIPFQIDDKTKDVFSKLFNLYKELFKKRFEEVVYGDNIGSEEQGVVKASNNPYNLL